MREGGKGSLESMEFTERGACFDRSVTQAHKRSPSVAKGKKWERVCRSPSSSGDLPVSFFHFQAEEGSAVSASGDAPPSTHAIFLCSVPVYSTFQSSPTLSAHALYTLGSM